MSHTHLQFAQANASTKNCKRVCLRFDEKIKHEGTTMYISHTLRDTAHILGRCKK